MTKKEILEQFIEAGNFPNECVEWRWAKNNHGYGQFGNGDGRIIQAHRYVCEKVHGPYPEDKPHALHSCHNPACYNPNHLRHGSPSENMQDRGEAGRGFNPKGEENGRAKITEQQALEIFHDERSQCEIAADYGIDQTNVSRIKTGKLWSHATKKLKNKKTNT